MRGKSSLFSKIVRNIDALLVCSIDKLQEGSPLMKIRTKLLLALSTLPILLFILIGIGWSQIGYVNNISNLLKTDYDLAILAGQIRADIKDEGIRLRNLVIFTDEDARQKELIALQLENDAVKQNISLLESKVTTTEQKELIATLKNTNNEFNVYQRSCNSINF